jgi:hypothetical protein
MARSYIKLIQKFDTIPTVDQPSEPEETNYYERSDYTEEATKQLYENFESGLIETYLAEQEQRVQNVPIVKNPALIQ